MTAAAFNFEDFRYIELQEVGSKFPARSWGGYSQDYADADRVYTHEDVLNLSLVRTTDAVKPYNSADHIAVRQDAALLEKIRDEHEQRPSVITTSTAEDEFDDTRLGAVIGSNHYGDRYIEKWGALAGRAIERGEGKGADLSYGPFGDDVIQHMREHDTLQAAMRFGRDGNGAVVYVHTNTLPD